MDIEDKVFNLFADFLKDLSKTFPEIKNCLYRNYEKELVGENKTLDTCPKLKNFLNKIKDNEKLITDKNIELFTQDIELLEEISFKRLWEKNITEKTKETIWKYLQTFTIININMNSGEALKKLLNNDDNSEIKKEDISDKKTAKDLKKLKKLTENIQSEPQSEDNFDNMFGNIMNTDIGKLAQNVANDMDIEKMFGDIKQDEDPMKIMQKMMSPETMGTIFKNISGTLDDKVKKGEINPDKLKNDAENICESMKDNPIFGSLLGSMQQPMQQHQQQQQKKENTTELSKEEKRKILKQKIEAKKNERTK